MSRIRPKEQSPHKVSYSTEPSLRYWLTRAQESAASRRTAFPQHAVPVAGA